eukprot:jgi/Mesvir1/20296/Mv19899-RA.2
MEEETEKPPFTVYSAPAVKRPATAGDTGRAVGSFTARTQLSDDSDSIGGVATTKVDKVVPRVAWEGAGLVRDQDRMLKLQAENTSLKRELAEQEAKTKQLVARLARVEEAAKRALVHDAHAIEGTVEVGPGAGGAGRRYAAINAAKAKQFYAEQRIQELEEELRVAHKRIDEEHKKVLHFKALAKDLKLQLEETIRLTRSNRPAPYRKGGPVKIALPKRPAGAEGVPGAGLPGGLHGPPGGPRMSVSDNEDVSGEAARQFAIMRQELTGLREENDNLRKQLHVRGGDGSGAARVPESLSDIIQEEMRQQAAEVPRLRQELADARAALATFQSVQTSLDRSLVQVKAPGDGVPESEVRKEMKAAWERVNALQRRCDTMAAALAAVKSNNESLMKSYEDSQQQCAQLQRESARHAQEERRLALELEAAKELSPLLEAARRERMQLEKENQRLLAQAMAAPGTGIADGRRLQMQVDTLKRELAEAELGAAEARREAGAREREVQRLRGQETEVVALRAERDRLRIDLSRLKLELQETSERMQAGGAGTRALIQVPAPATGSLLSELDLPDTPRSPRGSVHEDVHGLKAELTDLRVAYSDQMDELQKTRHMLEVAEQLAEEYKAELQTGARAKSDSEAALQKKIDAQTRELERRMEKIRKLEAQIKKLLAGAGVVRMSADGALASIGEEADLSELGPNENILEITMMGATLDGHMLGNIPDLETFLTFDFYDHETQASDVVAGVVPNYDTTVQYIVQMDTFFLEYLDTKELTVELNRAHGAEFKLLGAATLPLRRVLDEEDSGTGRQVIIRYADILGPGGRPLGTIRFSLRMLRGFSEQLDAYRELAAGVRGDEPTTPDVMAAAREDDDPAAEAAAVAMKSPLSSAAVRVVIIRAVGLRPRAAGSEPPAPYVSYRFPGARHHDTPFGYGADPVFDDDATFPLARTPALERKLQASRLELLVFDDNDSDLKDAGLIGSAIVALAPLADGFPIEGGYPIRDASGQVRGQLYLSISWRGMEEPENLTSKHPRSDPSIAPGGAKSLYGTAGKPHRGPTQGDGRGHGTGGDVASIVPTPGGGGMPEQAWDAEVLRPHTGAAGEDQRLRVAGEELEPWGRRQQAGSMPPPSGSSMRATAEHDKPITARGVPKSSSSAAAGASLVATKKPSAVASKQRSPDERTRHSMEKLRRQRHAERSATPSEAEDEDHDLAVVTPASKSPVVRVMVQAGERQRQGMGRSRYQGVDTTRESVDEEDSWQASAKSGRGRGDTSAVITANSAHATPVPSGSKKRPGSSAGLVTRLTSPSRTSMSALPPLESHIIITVSKVQLGSEPLHDPAIRNVFVLFDFLADFTEVEDQRTHALPKKAGPLVYNFTRAFDVGPAHAKERYEVSRMVRSLDDEDALIPFCVVNEPEDSDEFEAFGSCQASLFELLDSGQDWVDKELTVISQDNQPVARLVVSIFAINALQSILRDP